VITVIAPHARPEFSDNLLANFRRQRGVEAQLLVVENGEAVGSLTSDDATIICSGAHQADAMNAGLAWLRANGSGPWARCDTDDYYGPDYLARVRRSLVGEGPIVSGMPWRFVMLDEGLHQFTNPNDVFTGGTLAASTADVAPFERYRDDDLRWCRVMRERGARFVEREPAGYCYDRTTRLAPRVIGGGSAVTRFGFGPSLFYGPHAMSAVDYPDLRPLCTKDPPTDAELMAELTTGD
jgi:hypothetical protein